jgi:type I restriction enzyme M protein
MSLSATIKSIQDIMRKDVGVDGDAQRIGQLAWLLFFKIFSDQDAELDLSDDAYESPIPMALCWDQWADSQHPGQGCADGGGAAGLCRRQAVQDLSGPGPGGV